MKIPNLAYDSGKGKHVVSWISRKGDQERLTDRGLTHVPHAYSVQRGCPPYNHPKNRHLDSFTEECSRLRWNLLTHIHSECQVPAWP